MADVLVQENSARIFEEFWVEPEDFGCMWGPFKGYAEAQGKIRELYSGDETRKLRILRSKTRVYPQAWQVRG